MNDARIYIGCAGWSIRKEHAVFFSADGTHLERYATRFNAVEINSSFYKAHQPATYARWAACVPDGFRFAVKLPKEISHQRRLVMVDDQLRAFLGQCTQLGRKLGPLLVQLPPSLNFESTTAASFFVLLRKHFSGEVVCEPRHRSWFESETERLLVEHRIARVAADPAITLTAAKPGGSSGLVYYRLHGSPQVYYSAYSETYLESLYERLAKVAKTNSAWCIFDNTALGAATTNAVTLSRRFEIAKS